MREDASRSGAPTVALRAAVPTAEDGRAFARYLDQAAEGFFRLMLGRRSETILAEVFLEPRHDLSYENVTFAECEGRRVGMVSGYTAEQHRQSPRLPLEQAAGRTLRMLLVSVLAAPLFRILDTIAEGDFYIQAIAVDPGQQGRGVGSRLLGYAEERARGMGCRRLALDVSAANQSARALYVRRGFEVESQWPRRMPIPGLRLLRMVSSLG